MKRKRIKFGTIRQKIILLLLAGVAFSFAHSPKLQWRIIKDIPKEWKKIDQKALKRSIRNLYRSRLISFKENQDGTTTVFLNKAGEQLAITYNLNQMKLAKQNQWDGKWRIVMFDIPEKHKKARDAFRFHLKQLGLLEYQKSVFITPYPCAKEIEYLREFWRVKKFVRLLRADKLDNELHFKQLFEI